MQRAFPFAVSYSIAQIKGIFHQLDHWRTLTDETDRHHIKASRLPFPARLGKVVQGGLGNLPALGGSHRLKRMAALMTSPGFHLDKNQGSLLFGNDIDLPLLGTIIPRKHAIAQPGKILAGKGLPLLPEGDGARLFYSTKQSRTGLKL